jgi:site-specific DNA recombinase
MKPAKPVRCAIYTRVSTDQGLEQDFNSLDAQYDASQAYIRSQAHAGWTPLRAKYDDGGFSGGNTDRPALQRLLDDVRASKVDVIVVYKVDRLTRSLADFAKLVELFDHHSVSFVSVTQQFNTTTSMGRLTLNVLLSFAQFEREVTSERIRDKIAASKRKGLWVGGMAPLGYDTKDRKISVNEAEAERVRTIFRSYRKLGTLNLLMADLRKRRIVTKVRALKSGEKVGGIPFTRGPLAHLLRNRFYIGEVAFKGEVLNGEQTAIVDRPLFEAVQAKLDAQVNARRTARKNTEALLAGRIFDDHGNRMTPSHARKRGIKYRYYLSAALLQAQSERAGSISRVPAAEVETLVIRSVRERLKLSASVDDRLIIETYITRVEIRPGKVVIKLVQAQRHKRRAQRDLTLHIQWHKPPSKRRREILMPGAADPQSARPIRAETRATLIAAIARGRRWLKELVDDATTDVDSIAKRERCSVRQVNMTISLAFLAPNLVSAAIKGRLPRGIGVERLRDAPIEWSRQYAMLGLPWQF